jgi:hypothetical protein
MTYKELVAELLKLDDEQLQSTVTVEITVENECFPAELQIAGKDHFALDEDHPIICIEN